MKRQVWRFWEEPILAALYPHWPTEQIAAVFGRSIASVYNQAHLLGLAKTPEALKKYAGLQPGHTLGRSTQFRKGQVPHNKGVRRPGWSSGRMRETWFRKGCRSGAAAKNWKPIGTIQPDTEGYLRIKLREAVHGKEPTGFGNTKVWSLYNRYLWEQHHGPIPPGHLVIFKDGDRSHCTIDNLALISMKANRIRNSMWSQLPRELALTIQLNGVLKRKIRSLQNGKKQNQ